VGNLCARDRRLTLRIMAREVYVTTESIRSIITTDFSKKHLCEVCAPQFAWWENAQATGCVQWVWKQPTVNLLFWTRSPVQRRVGVSSVILRRKDSVHNGDNPGHQKQKTFVSRNHASRPWDQFIRNSCQRRRLSTASITSRHRNVC
jgi:hypothetical protein